MKYAFYIYFNAVGIYALVTLPVLMMPLMYIISIGYVLLYGWFACALFALVFGLLLRLRTTYNVKIPVLTIAVIAAVAFAFQMIDVFDPGLDAWHSGGLLLFPVAGVLAGWISLFQYRKHLQVTSDEV